MNPIYFTGVTPGGAELVGGVFALQDEHGFPVDASFDECKRRQWEVDWLEALSDCWLNSPLKFESFARQAEALSGVRLMEMFQGYGENILSTFPKMRSTPVPVNTVCRYTLSKKRLHRKR